MLIKILNDVFINKFILASILAAKIFTWKSWINYSF